VPDSVGEILIVLVIVGLALTLLAVLALRIWRALVAAARAIFRGFASGGVSSFYPSGESPYSRQAKSLALADSRSRTLGDKLLSAFATGGVSLIYEPTERTTTRHPVAEDTKERAEPI
jgi:hypothetical protein